MDRGEQLGRHLSFLDSGTTELRRRRKRGRRGIRRMQYFTVFIISLLSHILCIVF